MSKKTYYTAVYVCLNCGEKMYMDIPRGQSIPILVPAQTISKFAEQGGWNKRAPECSYCGCYEYSHGKADRP